METSQQGEWSLVLNEIVFTAPLVLQHDLRVTRATFTPRPDGRYQEARPCFKVNGGQEEWLCDLLVNHDEYPLSRDLDKLFLRGDKVQFVLAYNLIAGPPGSITLEGRFETTNETLGRQLRVDERNVVGHLESTGKQLTSEITATQTRVVADMATAQRGEWSLVLSEVGVFTAPLVLRHDLRVTRVTLTLAPGGGNQVVKPSFKVNDDDEEEKEEEALCHWLGNCHGHPLSRDLDKLFLRGDKVQFTWTSFYDKPVIIKLEGRFETTNETLGRHLTDVERNVVGQLESTGKQLSSEITATQTRVVAEMTNARQEMTRHTESTTGQIAITQALIREQMTNADTLADRRLGDTQEHVTRELAVTQERLSREVTSSQHKISKEVKTAEEKIIKNIADIKDSITLQTSSARFQEHMATTVEQLFAAFQDTQVSTADLYDKLMIIFRERIAVLEALTKQHVTDTKEKILQHTTDTKDQLLNHVSASKEQLSREVIDTKTQLTKEVIDSKDLLTKQVTGIEDKLTKEVAETKNQLTEQFTTTTSQLSEVSASVQEMTATMAEQTKHVTDTMEQMSEVTATVKDMTDEMVKKVRLSVQHWQVDFVGKKLKEELETLRLKYSKMKTEYKRVKNYNESLKRMERNHELIFENLKERGIEFERYYC